MNLTDAYKKIEEKTKVQNDHFNHISKEIRKLENFLQVMPEPNFEKFSISEDFYIYFSKEKRRLMSWYNGNMRPLIEQPLSARKMVFDVLEKLVNFYAE